MNNEELAPIRTHLDAAGVPIKSDQGDWLALHERVYLLAVKRDAAVKLCGDLAEEKEAARRDLDDAQALLAERAAEIERLKAEIAGHDASSLLRHNADMRGIAMWREESPEERDLTWPSHDDLVCYLLNRLTQAEENARTLASNLDEWTQAAANADAEIDALRAEFNGRIREEERQASIARLQLASLQERAANLARAAQAVRAENEAMKAEAVELVPVAVHTDELATSLGRFPMLRHDLPGAVVVALRVLPGDAQLAQHFATEVRRVYPNAVVVVSREAPARTVRLFRVVPAGAQVVPLAPEPEQPEQQPEQRREQDRPGEPIPSPSVEDYTRALATQYSPEEVAEIVAAAQELADRQAGMPDVRPILRDACRMAVASPPASAILDAIRATGAVAPLASPATP